MKSLLAIAYPTVLETEEILLKMTCLQQESPLLQEALNQSK